MDLGLPGNPDITTVCGILTGGIEQLESEMINRCRAKQHF